MGGGVYLFGAGTMLKYWEKYIDWNDVEAVLDNNAAGKDLHIHGKPLISPNALDVKNVKKLVICVKYHMDEIAAQAVEMGIGYERIEGLGSYIKNNNPDDNIFLREAIGGMYDCAAETGAKNVLHVGDMFEDASLYFACDKRLTRWRKNENFEIALMEPRDKNKRISQAYDAIYNNISDVPHNKYDAAIISTKYLPNNARDMMRLTSSLSVRHIFFEYIPEKCAWQKELASICGFKVCVRKMFSAAIVHMDKYFQPNEVGMYVVAHKNFLMPPIYDDCYYVAGAGGFRDSLHDGVSDDIGDNISDLNPVINECTALYWLFKNVSVEHIGICHYRRYFLCQSGAKGTPGNILRSHEALAYLKNYDIIVAQEIASYRGNGMLHVMGENMDSEALARGLDIVRRLLEERQPEYVACFDQMMSGVTMFPCNMMVTRKEIFDRYCEWLFSFIIDAAKEFDPSKYDSYSKRAVGFIAERMLTVWLMKQNFKIKELPVWQTNA